MTVKTLWQITTSPIELRSGRRSIFAKIHQDRISQHLSEEVTAIRARGNKIIVYSELPDYELDVDVDVDVAPWDD